MRNHASLTRTLILGTLLFLFLSPFANASTLRGVSYIRMGLRLGASPLRFTTRRLGGPCPLTRTQQECTI